MQVHHDPSTCGRCGTALEPAGKPDPTFPVPGFRCPKCRTGVRCACDSCEALIALWTCE